MVIALPVWLHCPLLGHSVPLPVEGEEDTHHEQRHQDGCDEGQGGLGVARSGEAGTGQAQAPMVTGHRGHQRLSIILLTN